MVHVSVVSVSSTLRATLRSSSLVQPLAHLPRGDVLALLPGKWRVVDEHVHRNRGLLDGDAGQAFRRGRIGHGVTDVHALEARQRDDLAGLGRFDLAPFQPLERVDLAHPRLFDGFYRVDREQRHGLAKLQRAAFDASDPQPSEVGRVVDGRDEHLQRARDVRRGRWYVLDDRIEQWGEIGRRLGQVHRRHAEFRRAVHDGRVELGVVSLEFDEEVEHLVADARRIRPGAVDLVDHDDRRAPEREGLSQHEPRLRHRTVEGVDHEQDAVHHAQDPLDLTPEIGVPGRIHDVELGTVPPYGRVLRENGDSPLALERIGIHHALGDDLVLPERSRLAEHLVYQRRLAVIDVCDNGDVAELHVPES